MDKKKYRWGLGRGWGRKTIIKKMEEEKTEKIEDMKVQKELEYGYLEIKYRKSGPLGHKAIFEVTFSTSQFQIKFDIAETRQFAFIASEEHFKEDLVFLALCNLESIFSEDSRKQIEKELYRL